MAARIQVTQLDGRPIRFQHAALRSAVDVALWIGYALPTLYVLSIWDGPWATLSWVRQSQMLADRNPTYDLYSIASQVWLWSELVVLLFNKKRRALHDFIAGTVVIKKARRAKSAINPAASA